MDNGKYRQLFRSSPIDFCQLMAGAVKTKSNPLVKTLLTFLKKGARNMVHLCPYYKEHIALNLTMDRSLLMIYPFGSYRFYMRDSDKLDENIWTIKISIDLF